MIIATPLIAAFDEKIAITVNTQSAAMERLDVGLWRCSSTDGPESTTAAEKVRYCIYHLIRGDIRNTQDTLQAQSSATRMRALAVAESAPTRCRQKGGCNCTSQYGRYC